MATIDEIAEAAGVSRGTVSNILNGKNKEERPSAIRRANQVRELAAQLGYRPNAAARAVRSRRFRNAGLLLAPNDELSGMPEAVWRGIMHTLAEHDMHLVVGDLPIEDDYNAGRLPKLLREWSVDGLLISYYRGIPQGLLSLIHEESVPTVWLNVPWEENSVYPDDHVGAKQATEYLISQGHRRIAYCDLLTYDTFTVPHYSQQYRAEGYQSAMTEAGLPPRFIRPDRGLDCAECAAFTTHWLESEWRKMPAERLTAIVAYEAVEASSLFLAATRCGIAVPQTLSLITFHAKPVVSQGVAISTVEIPAYALGVAAVNMLVDKIDRPDVSVLSKMLPLGLGAIGMGTIAIPEQPK